MITRDAVPADIPRLAELHMTCLPGDVSDFTLLGRGIVRRFYAVAQSRRAASVIVAADGGELAGFVVITHDVSALFPSTLLAGPADVARFFLTANPVGLVRAAIAKVSSGTTTVAAVPELVYLGVDGRYRGRGVGGMLVDAADVAFLAAGVAGYELNVHASNASACRLYLAKGLEVTRRYSKGGHEMLAMERRLSPPAQPS